MGNFIERNILSRFRTTEYKILMIGLDAAGKTTILYKMKLGEVITTVPTIGFNVETVEYRGINFTTWDVGSRDKIRPLWRHYFQYSQALMFVVDSNDRDRLEEAAEEFNNIVCEDELRDAVILVIANKQDLSDALNVNMIAEALSLHKVQQKCNIFPVCATKGEGLTEALDWLADMFQSKDISIASVQTGKAKDELQVMKPSIFSKVTEWFKSTMKPV